MTRLLPLLALTSLAAAAPTPPPLDPADFALLPWWVIPNEPGIYKGVAECGFNLIMLAEPTDLDDVRAAGLQAIVTGPNTHVGDTEAGLPDAEIAARVQVLVEAAADHPATWGFYLRDEPSAVVFHGLGRWKAAYNAAAPGKRCYINLFPNYASPAQLGAATYEDHLREFVAQVQPDFISYDHYAMMEGNVLRDGYFQNLEAVRAAALEAGLPFWNIVLGNAHFNYAEPSPATLRFQAFTTLAYGARGLSYFTYVCPPVGNYRLAPLDQYLNKTPTYDMMREVNLRLRFIIPTYLRYTSRHVYHLGDEPPTGGASAETKQLPLTVAGGDLLVGEFNGPDGRSAVMVVNKSLTSSAHVTVTPDNGGSVNLVSPFTGAETGFGGEQLWLAPGQGSFLILVP